MSHLTDRLSKEERNQYPNQEITWDYEKEVKPVPVLIDIEAGNRTNLLINVFHLPHETLS